jgi:hypothetical protein
MSKRLITLDISPATATHCGDGHDRHCRKMFRGTESASCDEFHRGLGSEQIPLRLPECIAAEQNAAQKGGGQ